MLQSKTPWLILLLGSLILNAVTLSRVDKLDDQVNELSRNVNNLTASSRETQSKIDAVSRAFSKLEEEQRWLPFERWQVDYDALSDGCRGPLPISFEWTFSELPPGAAVAVEVRAHGAGRWQSLRAEQTGHLAYRAETKLDPTQSWEYRVISASPAGNRASSPKPVHELETVTRKHVRLDEGETYSTGGKHWARYLLLPHQQVQSPCSRVSAAALEVLHEGKVIEVREMENKRPPEGPPVALGAGGSASSSSSDGTGFDLGWWTDWIELPARSADVRVKVTFSDGVTAVVPLRGECCPPTK